MLDNWTALDCAKWLGWLAMSTTLGYYLPDLLDTVLTFNFEFFKSMNSPVAEALELFFSSILWLACTMGILLFAAKLFSHFLFDDRHYRILGVLGSLIAIIVLASRVWL